MKGHARKATADSVAAILRRYLSRGAVLHLDGLGTLRGLPGGEFEFERETRPTVFIGYASEDLKHARRLSRQLRAAGLRPWLDQEKLLPGQNWPRAIERAIRNADFAIQCFSSRVVRRRRSYFYRELRQVLEYASRTPLEEVFLLPVRLEECSVPDTIVHQYQYVDLFPDWDRGVKKLVEVIRKRHEHSCDTT